MVGFLSRWKWGREQLWLFKTVALEYFGQMEDGKSSAEFYVVMITTAA